MHENVQFQERMSWQSGTDCLFDNRGFFAKAWSRGGSLQEGRSGGRIVELDGIRGGYRY